MNLLFVDIDWTLVCPYSNSRFINNKMDQQIRYNTLQRLQEYSDRKWWIFGVSNQAGVDAGHITLQQLQQKMIRTIELSNFTINSIFCCTDFAGQQLIEINSRFMTQQCTASCNKLFDHNLNHDYATSPDDDRYIGLFRKPNPGIVLWQIAQLKARGHFIEDVLIVGDRCEDQQMALKVQKDLCQDVEFQWAKDWRKDTLSDRIWWTMKGIRAK